jgi:hypothetical protein
LIERAFLTASKSANPALMRLVFVPMAQSSLTRFAGDLRVSITWMSVPGLAHYEERVRSVATDRRVTLVFASPYLRHAPTSLEVERMDGASLVLEHHTLSYEEGPPASTGSVPAP